MGFLPVNEKEIRKNGWDAADFVIVTGDAYVDHPSFGTAIISRMLEHAGYRVAILPQPDFTNEESIAACGKPRLAFLVNAGNMDSMVNHYTAAKKPRSEDAYSPGGKAGRRPDRAVIVYCNMIRKKYGKIPVVIGGIEASLRRLGHYDYWQDKVRRSILLDSGADILSYGMGEHSIIEIADFLAAGKDVSEITDVRGTVVKSRELPDSDIIELPAFDEICKDKKKYAESFAVQYANTDPFTAKVLSEQYGENRYVVQNIPALPLTTEEMDMVYGLPYMGEPHPMYEKEGGIPAIEEVRFSLTSTRGCFGSCSFCALSFHEGRIVQARSHASILKEAEKLTRHPLFKGYLHDVGGPTADFRFPACKRQLSCGTCRERQCLFPSPCPNLNADHSDYTELLKKLRKLPGVKKVFVRSGIRFDYVMEDIDRCRKQKAEAGKKTGGTPAQTAAGKIRNTGEEFLDELTKYHISGQLRVAPEHVSDNVLKLMGKPGTEVYKRFLQEFERSCKRTGMEQQFVVPYLISSHPGSDLKDAVKLAEAIRDMGYMPEQVQDFYPTPSTLSTCMYYTGLDPRTGKAVKTATEPHEKAMQRALLQYRKPENYRLVKEALLKAGREDLIGFDKRTCLIPPREIQKKKYSQKKNSQK